MPGNTKTTVRRSGVQPVAPGTLVALACMALASCGGGPGAAHPDLVVEDPVVSKHRSDAEPSFTFSATVRNAGRGHAAATMLRVYRSVNETITPADEEMRAVTVAELAASASHDASVMVMAPPSPGTHYYGACVAPVAGESDIANNCSAAIQVTVPEVQVTRPASPRPDLVVADSEVSDRRPTAGARFTFRATVRNDGDGEAAATTLHVYRSDDATMTPSDREVDAAEVPKLAALASRAESWELSAPSSSGTYYYRACVDPVAGESATANNCSAPMPVMVQDPQVPVQTPQVPVSGATRLDLQLVGPWVDNANPARGGVFRLSAQVRLLGTTRLLKETTRFYRSTDATITRSDTQVADRYFWFGTFTDNWEVFHNVWVKAPSSNGTYYFGACVDVVAGESDTTNNCSAAVTVKVSHNKPDVRVGSWSAASPRPAGKSIRLAMTAYNYGSPSSTTTLRLFQSPNRMGEPSDGTQVAEVDVPELVVTHGEPAKLLRYVEYGAPSTAGRYHYVACVDAVLRESNTTNNCSPHTTIEFR
ncbi:MAG: hypothetical protein OXP69_07940 [Spirochaetaceae bacterium]|nr:hypothetical protein [Spirochaetaceae bacterium]